MKPSPARQGAHPTSAANIAVLAAAWVFAHGAIAQPVLPTSATVTAGSATISSTSTSMTVIQTTPRTVIDWTSFNIGSGALVTFDQPGTTSVAVNRVGLGGGQSVIDGVLSANGHVMLLNPNGIAFTSGAVVNVAGLIASTGNIDVASFMSSPSASIAITGATTGSIVNAGSITVSDAGLAAFVAPSVANSGAIVASSGRIVLAGAQAATVSLNGSLYEMTVDQAVVNGTVANSGTLQASNGTILLSAEDASSVVSGVINLSGIQQANRIEVRGNHVVLTTDLDAATVAGNSSTIEVQGGAQIQDAISIAKVGSAGAGATVDVHAGIYAEQVQINKANLTLSGRPGAQIAVPNGSDVNGITITANTNRVTVSGFEIAGPVDSSYLTYPWGSNVTRGLVVRRGANDFTLTNNNIRDIRTGILIDGRDSAGTGTVTGTVAGNTIENTKSGISVQYTDGSTLAIAGNSEGPIGNEWGVNLHLNGFLDGGTLYPNPHLSAPTPAWQQSLLDLSAANGGWPVMDQGYSSSNRTHVNVATTGSDASQGSLLTPRRTVGGGLAAIVSGGTVDIAPGTYVQTSTLNVSKSVTLTGAGEGQTTIDARGVSGYGVSVSADNVTLSDLTVYGPSAFFPSAYGIKVSPGGAPSSRLRNFTIRNVTSRGAGKAELDLNGVEGATIDHFTADGAPVGDDNGTTQGAGIQLTDSANVSVTGTTTRNNAWGGIAIYQANRSYDQQANNITIAASNTLSETNPLYLQDESSLWDFGALSMPGFSHAVRNAGTTDSAQYTWMQGSEQGAIDFAVNLPNAGSSYVRGWNGTALTQNFYVGVGNLSGGGMQAMSIAAAVDKASEGATISVGAGTFAEQLTIARTLSLVGAGADQTILAPVSLQPDASGARSIVTISGSATSVDLSGFTLMGPVPAITAGIFVRDGAHAYIHENRLTDMRESAALSGNQRGIGIFVGRASYGTSGTAVIENNVITGYQKGGIVIDGPGSGATISGNTITGEGPTGVIAQNGIQASRGATATISRNTVSGNNYTGDDEAVGILLYTPGAYLDQGAISVGANTVTNNEVGIWTNDPRTLSTINLAGSSGNSRNAVASFEGGYAGMGPLLEYPAWAPSNAARVDVAGFAGTSSGDIIELSGALRVTGWDGFAAIQPAVDAVAAGGTINIAAGTYAENVTVNGLRNLSFSGTTVDGLTLEAGASGSGLGGSLSANGTAGITLNAPVVLLSNTTLGAGTGAVSAGAIDGTTAGAQALTVNAGAVTLGALGAGTQLGATVINGQTVGLSAPLLASSLSGSSSVVNVQAGARIRDGIDIAAAGGSVSVVAGTFAENVTVNGLRNLSFGGTTVNGLTLEAGASGSGLGGSLSASTPAGISLNAPVVLLTDTTLGAGVGALSTGAIDGKTAGGQALTVNAGTVTLGNLGAATRLGGTDVTGTAITLAGSDYNASALTLTGPTTLTQASTTLATNGGALSTGAIDGTTASTNALTVNAGAVTLGNLGATTRLGATAMTGTTIRLAGSSYNTGALTLTGPTTLTQASTTLATNGGVLNMGPIDGTTAGTNALTINAGAVTLGALGAGTQLGATVIDGQAVDLSAPLLASSLSGSSSIVNVQAGARIQDGVDIGASGGSVNVVAGTFAENVTVNGLRNLSFGGTTVNGLTLNAGASGSGLGGSLSANGAAGISLNAPVVLLTDTTLGAGALSAGAIDGTGTGGQALTVDAGAVTLGNLGAATRLGGTDVTGTAITLAGSDYNANALTLTGPTTLTQASTTLAANGGALSTGAINGTTASTNALTVNAGAVTLGNLGATTRLGTTQTTGTSITLAGSSYNTGALTLTGPVTLTQASTTLATNGGAIAIGGDVQGAGSSRALLVLAGSGATRGDVTMVSGGSPSNPLGAFDVEANNFTLTGTLWVADYRIDGRGAVALSDHTLIALNPVSSNLLNAAGTVTGTTTSSGSVKITGGGMVNASVTAQVSADVSGADVSGSVAGGNVTVSAQNSANATITAQNNADVTGGSVGGSVSGSNVTIAAQNNASATVSAQNEAKVTGASVSGSVSGSNVTIVAQNDASANVTAQSNASVTGGNVSGNVSGSNVTVVAQNSSSATVSAQNSASVTGTNVSGNISGSNVTVAAMDANVSVTAASTAKISATNTVQATVSAVVTQVQAGTSATVSGSSSALVVDAPTGSATGSFDAVANVGPGLIAVNGRPIVNTTVASNVESVSSVIPPSATVLGNVAGASEARPRPARPAGLNTTEGFPILRVSPDFVGDHIMYGWSVEIDLSPRLEERTQ